MRDGSTLVKASTAVAALVGGGNGLVTGLVIDTAEFDTLTFVFQVGIMADGGATWTVTVYDDDAAGMGTEAVVADEFLIGTEAAVSWDETADATVRKIGYIGPKRYVRVKVQPADNASSDPFSCVAIQGHSKKGPQTTQAV